MNHKLKIAICTFGFFTGGTERQLIELLKGIDRNRFTLYVVAVRAGGQMEANLKQAGIEIIFFPINSLHNIDTLRQLYRLSQFFIKEEIDILHTFSLIGNTFGVLAGLLARTPIIITSRRDMFGPKMLLPYGPIQGLLSHCVDGITTNARAIKEMLTKQEYVRANKVSVIPNGLDLNQFIDRSEGATVRKELGIEADAPVIGVVAELKPVKGHIYLFRAIQSLIKIRPKMRVLIVGDSIEPAFKTSLEAASQELGIQDNVIFLGRSQTVARLLTAMDISVLPSLSEGLSNTILESMGAGVPIIAANVGGNSELIQYGETGLLVPPADPLSLANAIVCLLDDIPYRNRLAANALAFIRNKFSITRMVGEFESLYLKLAESKVTQTKPVVRLGLRRRLGI